jgi:hypothetical protein
MPYDKASLSYVWIPFIRYNSKSMDEVGDPWDCKLCNKIFAESDARVLECQRCKKHFCIKCLKKSNTEYDILSKSDTIFCYKVYNPKDHQLRPWILNCILGPAIFVPLTARSDKASLLDLNFFYLLLCIGLPYTLQFIIRASLIKICL